MQLVPSLMLAAACWLVALPARSDTSPTSRTNVPADKPKAPAAPAAAPATANQVHTSPGRQKIYAKLDAIRLDAVAYDALPLGEVIKALDAAALSRDPEKRGINFLLSTTADPQPIASPAIDPRTGLPVAASAEGGIETTVISISPPQREITLRHALDILVLVADSPIKYTVTDWGVLITFRGEQSSPLHTRGYNINPNTFGNGLQGVVPSDFGPARSGNSSTQPARVDPTFPRDPQGTGSVPPRDAPAQIPPTPK